jgi:hypothetical protein
MKAFIPLSGIKLPEKITRDEFEKLFNEMRQRFDRRLKKDGGPEKKP